MGRWSLEVSGVTSLEVSGLFCRDWARLRCQGYFFPGVGSIEVSRVFGRDFGRVRDLALLHDFFVFVVPLNMAIKMSSYCITHVRRSIQKKNLAGMLAPLRNVVQYRSACFSAEHNSIFHWGAGILAPQRSVVQYRSACFSAEQN